MSLINRFNKTNLDLENPAPAGGPINDPQSNYTHKYTNKDKYLDNFSVSSSPNSIFGTEGENIQEKSSFEKTNLDLERNLPTGGPINDPSSGFVHKYTRKEPYLDKFQGARSLNSDFGTIGKEILPNSIFATTGLDVENPNAGVKQGGTGGPNRTNSYNVPTGIYTFMRSTNIFNESTNYDVGILREKNNTIKNFLLHKYTPTNLYLDSQDWKDKFNQY
jgi:hypothetical protein